MSATLESEILAKYFSETITRPGDDGNMIKTRRPAPVLNVDSEPYSVVEYFLDSIFRLKHIGLVSNFISLILHNFA